MRDLISLVETANIDESATVDILNFIKDHAVLGLSALTVPLISSVFKLLNKFNETKHKVESYRKSLMLLGIEIDQNVENAIKQVAMDPKLEDEFVTEIAKFLIKSIIEDVHAVASKMTPEDRKLAWNMIKQAADELLTKKSRNATALAKLAMWLNEYYPEEKSPKKR